MLQAQLQREAWGSALQRATGAKVLDDPRLLKKSLKKVGGGRGGRAQRNAAGQYGGGVAAERGKVLA